jgi:hypothetical protein
MGGFMFPVKYMIGGRYWMYLPHFRISLQNNELWKMNVLCLRFSYGFECDPGLFRLAPEWRFISPISYPFWRAGKSHRLVFLRERTRNSGTGLISHAE